MATAATTRSPGGAHHDLLHGGNGKDLLTGRAGADWFYFDTAWLPAT